MHYSAADAYLCRLAASGERQGYYGCQFLGYQDTLYARAGVQYYSNCYIEGTASSFFFYLPGTALKIRRRRRLHIRRRKRLVRRMRHRLQRRRLHHRHVARDSLRPGLVLLRPLQYLRQIRAGPDRRCIPRTAVARPRAGHLSELGAE